VAADILIAILLIIGAYRGFHKGLLMSIIAIFAFILGVMGGFRLLHWGINLLTPYLGEMHGMLPYVSFIIIFISIALIISILGKILKKVLDFTLLGPVDRLAGALVGVLKWAFTISVLLWLTLSVGFDIPDNFEKGSTIMPYIQAFGPKVVQITSVIIPSASEIFHSVFQMLQPKVA
jgi:membrane protein required for colicin V production